MAELPLTAQAPESNVAETPAPAPAPSDAPPAAAAPKVTEHCTTDRPTPAGYASTGELTKINDIDVYVSKPADYPHTPAKLLLFLTGGTGLRSTNNQIQADRYATEGGFLVVMPDLFAGDAAPNSRAPIEEANPSVSASATDNDEASSSFLDTIKLKAVETAKSFLIDMWLARHTEEKVLPRIHAVLDGCREKFPDAIAAGGGIYAVGYCFGGRYVLLLAAKKTAAPAEPASPGVAGWASAVSQTFSSVLSPSSRTDEAAAERGEVKSEGPFIKAGALAHATMVSPDDFVGLVSPVSLVCVEDDPVFPDSVRVAGEEYMEKNGVEHEVHVYPGVPHGFAVVGDYDDAKIKEAQAIAFEQMLKWLVSH